MLKIVLILFVSCKFGNSFEVFELQEFGLRVRNLSVELFQFTEQNTKGNLVLAPYTIWNLISLVAFNTLGESWKQFHSIISFPRTEGQYINSIYKHITELLLRKTPGVSFETKYVVFYDANIDLSRRFKRSIVNSGAFLRMLNFDETVLSSKLANDNIRLHGDVRLQQTVFNKADFETSSMIVSGIVEFQGDWSLPFDESDTIVQEGYNGSVYMMRQRARVYYSHIDMLSASAMQLTYGEIGDYSMLLIRPYYNVPIDTVISNLAKISVSDIFDELYGEGLKEIDIELPKFSITSVLELNNPFKSFGVSDIFVPERANFSELSSSEDMYIYNIEHRAVLMVSETGTVARAFTPANLPKGSRKSVSGTASPFLFFIVHVPSMTILFCGKYGG